MKFIWVRKEDVYDAGVEISLSSVFDNIEDCRVGMRQDADKFADEALNVRQVDPDLFVCREGLLEIITETETVEWCIKRLEDEEGNPLQGSDQFVDPGDDIPSPLSLKPKTQQQRNADLLREIIPKDWH